MTELRTKLEPPAPTKHHPGGPSSLGRIVQCPASYLASAGCEEQQSDDADEGTMLHARLAERLAGGEHDWSDLTDEQIETLDKCVEFFMRTVAEAAQDGDPDVYLEQMLPIKLPSITVLDYGTMDVAVVWPDAGYGIVIDWKFGRGDLDTKDGAPLQVGAYGTMALQQYGLTHVDGYIYQPRVSDRPFHIELNTETAESTAAAIETALNKGGEEDAPFNPGAPQCDYCPIKPTCGALKKLTMELEERRPQVPTDPRKVDEEYDKAMAAKRFLDAYIPELRRRIREGCSKEWATRPHRGKSRVTADPLVTYGLLEESITQHNPGEGIDEPTPFARFLAKGSWALQGLREISGLKPKELSEVLGDAIERGDDYLVIVRAERISE